MRIHRLIRIGLAATALACSGSALAINFDLGQALDSVKQLKTAVVGPDEQQEHDIGRIAAATLLGAAQPVDNAALQAYVGKVGLWVALQSERPDLPWRFAVLQDDTVNAFAAPGGYVFVTRGLVARLHNEAELAGALGHEIAHVVLKHQLAAIRRDAGTQLLGTLTAGAVAQRAGRANIPPQVVDAVSGQAKTLYSRGLDKSDEYAADALGAQLAARAGYDPYGLMAVLETLDGMDSNDSSLALLYKTHPRPADRLTELETIRDKLDAFGQQPTLDARFQSGAAAVLKK
jgi:predicted Zn-dependent protease